MLLLSFHEPLFVRLIHEIVPSLTRLDGVQAAMKKYTSGYLTQERLRDAMKPGPEPMVKLTTFEKPTEWGSHQKGLIEIGTHAFQGFKEGHETHVRLLPITVLHEFAHWGYWKGQQNGHPSDTHGREHQNHGEYKSPLTAELEKVIGAYVILTRPHGL